MIGIIATLQVKPEAEADFERAFLAMAAAVRANEPDNLAYQLCRSRTAPHTYKVLELYRSDAAIEAHRASQHYREGSKALAAFVAAPPHIETLDAVVD